MSGPLRIVETSAIAETPAETSLSDGLAERVHQLQAEARHLALEHIDLLRISLLRIHRIAEEIAQGGDAYPPGVRDIARRLVEESLAKAITLETIATRR